MEVHHVSEPCEQQPYRKCIDIAFVETILIQLSLEKQAFDLELRLWHLGWFDGEPKRLVQSPQN